MNWSIKVAKSLQKDKSLDKHQYTARICQIAIALCIATILVSSFMIRGFEQKIEDKIFHFWSHIRIFPLSTQLNTLIETPIQLTEKQLADIQSEKQIEHISYVVNKGVILKTSENIEGIILKGVDLSQKINSYNLQNTQNLSYTSDEIPIILSQNTLDRLDCKIGAKIFVHVIDSHPKIFKGKVINSYSTNIEEFDSKIALSDIHTIQRLNNWKDDEYSWIELYIRNRNQIGAIAHTLYQKIPDVNVESIYNLFPQMFDWLALMKRNELIILIVMLVVAIINVISTISIFILEKTQFIGMLKVLGARNRELYYLIFYQISSIILRGIVYGNILAILIAAILYYFKPIRLDPSIYYISYAPVTIDYGMWLFINMITILVCLITAWIPLMAISKISPVKVVEYR